MTSRPRWPATPTRSSSTPTSSTPASARASLLLDDGRLEAARADVNAGLALDPEHAELHAVHAIDRPAGHARRGARAYAEALRHDPTLAAAWSNRATLWFEQGEIERAIEDLRTALELDDDPDIRANLELATAALR